LDRTFPSSLPDKAARSLYYVTLSGPLSHHAFQAELSAAVKAENMGGRISSSWLNAVKNWVDRIHTSLEPTDREPPVPSNLRKRKRADLGIFSASAATIGIRSRLLATYIRAVTGIAGNVAEEAGRAASINWSSTVDGVNGQNENVSVRSRRAEGELEQEPASRQNWSRDVILSARLVVGTAMAHLDPKLSSTEPNVGEVLDWLTNAQSIPELRIQSVSLPKN